MNRSVKISFKALAAGLGGACVIWACTTPSALSSIFTWNGTVDDTWANASDWSPGGAPPGAADAAIFNATNNGNTSISLGTGISVAAINFEGSTSPMYTIGTGPVGSQTLTLGSGGGVEIEDGTVQSNQLVNAATVLGGTAGAGTFTFGSQSVAGATLTLAGAITGGTGGTAGTKTIVVQDNGNTVISGAIGGGGGVIALTKTGAGTLTIGGNNTFTGTLTISAGTVAFPTLSALGAGGIAFSPASGGGVTTTLEYSGTASGTVSKPITLGNFAVAKIQVDSSSADVSLGGVISGPATVEKSGPGTLTLTGANTYSVATLVDAGTLVLSGSGKLGSTAASLAVNGAVDLGGTSQSIANLAGAGIIYNNGTSAAVLTVKGTDLSQNYFGTIVDNLNSGTGTMALTVAGDCGISGANTYSGPTNVTSGVLTVSSNGELGNTTGGTTVSSGATLSLVSVIMGAEAITISGMGAGSGSGAITNSGTSTYSGLLKLAAASAISSDGTLTLSNTGTIAGSGFGLTLTGGGTGFIDSIIGIGAGALTKSGASNWTLSGANTYSGLTTVSAGTLTIANSSALGATTSGTVISAGATLVLEGGISEGAEALRLSGAGVNTIGALESLGGTNNYAGLITLGAASTIVVESNILNLTNTGTITGAGFSLTLTGSGIGTVASIIGLTTGSVSVMGGDWTFFGANTYTGGTTIGASGLLELSGSAKLGGTSGSLTNDGVLDLNDTTQGVGALAGTASAFIKNNGGNAVTFTVGNGNGGGTYAGVIEDSDNLSGGTIGLTKAGTGTIVLSGDNIYSGPTKVTAGILEFDTFVPSNSTGTTVTSGATLRLSATGFTTGLGGAISLAGTGASGATGALEGNGNNSVTGTITLTVATTISSTSGMLSLDDTASIGGANINLTLAGAGNGFVAGVIGTGTGTLTKTGAGGWVLAGANTYSGLTTVSAGTLEIQSDSGLGATSSGTTVANGGTLQLLAPLGGTLDIAEPLLINGDGPSSNGALESFNGTFNYSGLVTLGSASTIYTQAGFLNLTNLGTITGSGFALTLDGISTGSIASIIGTGAGTLTKNGSGTWKLTGANTFTGPVKITAGTLNIQNSTALGTIAGGTTVSSGATLQLQGGIAVGAEALNLSGAGASGAGALENVSGTNIYGGLLTLGANTTISVDAGSLALSNSGTIAGAGFNLTLAGTGTGSIASIIGTGSGGVAVSLGTWTLSGANTFTGSLSVGDTAVLHLPSINNSGVAGPLGAGTGAVSLSTNVEIDFDGPTASTTRNFSLAERTVFKVTQASSNIILSGSLNGGTFTSIDKLGPGMLTFAGSNTFSQETLVNQGTLALAATGALGDSMSLQLDIGTTLLLQGQGNLNRIADNTSIQLQSATTISMAGLSNSSETLGTFDQGGTTTIDFGTGNGNNLTFGAAILHTAGLGLTLTVLNWSGTPFQEGSVSNDRLIFTGALSDFTSHYAQSDVVFNGMAGYDPIQIDATHYEIVMPEPSAAGLCLGGLLLVAGCPRWRGRHWS